MSGMNEYLSEFYGTNKTASDESVDTAATYELFAKLASDNGIDLNALSNDQIAQLYSETFKTAEEGKAHEGKESEEEEELEEKAKKEHAEKKEASEKFAEADFLGRQMAHAFMNEWNAINGTDKVAAGKVELGVRARDLGSKALSALTDAATGKTLREGMAAKKNVQSDLGTRMLQQHAMHNIPKGSREEAIKGMRAAALESAGQKVREGAKRTGALYGGVGAVGTAGAAAHHYGKKEASALDILAAQEAVKIAMAAGYDGDEAVNRLDAVLTLGLGESTKVASADFPTAVNIRALEVLEAAGYPVNWS